VILSFSQCIDETLLSERPSPRSKTELNHQEMSKRGATSQLAGLSFNNVSNTHNRRERERERGGKGS